MKKASNDADYNDPNMFFEYWSNLAKIDPKRFESERIAEIEKVISQASVGQQQELRQLQWSIDGERRRAKNPIDAMIRLNKMMWKQVHAPNGFFSLIDHFNTLRKCLIEIGESVSKRDAVVISLKKD